MATSISNAMPTQSADPAVQSPESAVETVPPASSSSPSSLEGSVQSSIQGSLSRGSRSTDRHSYREGLGLNLSDMSVSGTDSLDIEKDLSLDDTSSSKNSVNSGSSSAQETLSASVDWSKVSANKKMKWS